MVIFIKYIKTCNAHVKRMSTNEYMNDFRRKYMQTNDKSYMSSYP